MIRWGHGHSIGVGALLTLALLHGHYLWALSAVFCAGLLLGRAWGSVGAFLRRFQRSAWPVVEHRARRPW